jgi:hypothetical protein
MSTKKTGKETAKPANNELRMMDNGKVKDRQMADLLTEGVVANAMMLRAFSADSLGDSSITECVHSLRESARAVNAGALAPMEAILVSQVSSLNTIFMALALRAQVNIEQYPQAMERFMRLALKAQSQARATVETLANIKNPLVFAKHANINNGGMQQVNHGIAQQPQLPAAQGMGASISALPAAGTELFSHAETLSAFESSKHRTPEALAVRAGT